MAGSGGEPEEALGELARTFETLANPLRLALLNRLQRPAFMPDLEEEFGLTRQALQRHLDDLVAVGLLQAQASRRGALRATRYVADPAGLFAFKDTVLGLGLGTDPAALLPKPTRQAGSRGGAGQRPGAGLLLVHGDLPGRWFELPGYRTFTIGRDASSDVVLAYDPYASQRHALLKRDGAGWTLTDLGSTNGTRRNLVPLSPSDPIPVRPGDLLTIGKSHLLLQGA